VFPKFSIRTIRTVLFIHLWPWFTRCLIYTPIVTIRYPHTLSNVQWGTVSPPIENHGLGLPSLSDPILFFLLSVMYSSSHETVFFSSLWPSPISAISSLSFVCVLSSLTFHRHLIRPIHAFLILFTPSSSYWDSPCLSFIWLSPAIFLLVSGLTDQEGMLKANRLSNDSPLSALQFSHLSKEPTLWCGRKSTNDKNCLSMITLSWCHLLHGLKLPEELYKKVVSLSHWLMLVLQVPPGQVDGRKGNSPGGPGPTLGNDKPW
jgi:hypothetical protein